jgi:hypothetical protein
MCIFSLTLRERARVSRDILGPYFDGTLVTDCYAGYEAHHAKAKQKCLAHLARTARYWQKVVPPDSEASTFFTAIQETAKCHVRRPTDIFYRLYTRPPNQVLRYLYAGRSRSSRR